MSVRSTVRTRRRRFDGAVLACAVLFASACSALPSGANDPLAKPKLAVAVSAYAGSPLRGVLAPGAAALVDADPSHALALDCSLVYVEHWPAKTPPGAPLVENARLVVAVPGGELIQPVAQLANGMRALTPAEWRALAEAPAASSAIGRTVDVYAAELALAGGLTQSLAIASTPGGEHGRVTIGASRRAEDGAVELSFVLASADAPARASAESGVAPRPRRDLVLLAGVLAAGDEGERVFAWPARALGIEKGAFVARLALHAAPDASDALVRHAAQLETALACAYEAETAAHDRSAYTAGDEMRRHERVSALATLALATNRRAALAFLASSTEASLCADLALTAEDPLLNELVEALVHANADSAALANDANALGWHLERGAWLFLAARLEGETPLPVGLRGLLARHAGEVARSSGAIEDLVRASSDVRDLAKRVALENTICLEDANPSTRVRAFDWLVAHAAAPAGFDPLGTADARKRALAEIQTVEPSK